MLAGCTASATPGPAAPTAAPTADRITLVLWHGWSGGARQALSRLVERFKFYNRFAWGPETLLRRPLQQLARWRCARNFYAFPVEKAIVERLKPLPKLS